MNPLEIIEQTSIDGLTLSISADERISIIGDRNIISEWLPLIREHKDQIMVLLQREMRQKQVLEMLDSDPMKRYAVICEDPSSDPVLLTVAIKGAAAFELEIPHAHYDGVALLEVIEQFSTDAQLERKAA